MDFSLTGKVALVTGGSHGIGQATALGFAQAGADVVLAGRKIEDLEKVAGEIKKRGRDALAVAAHVGRMEDIDNLVARAVEKFGKIDILVNNAGTNPTVDSALDVEERAWDSLMNLNLKGLFFLSQKVARVMKEKGGGCIINVSSVEGVRPGVLPAYAISKAGVVMATKVMAQEWAQYGIRVNCIAPGITKTRFTQYFWDHPDIMEELMKKVPMRRTATTDEMAGTMIYLASNAASYVNGVIIPVDGGAAI